MERGDRASSSIAYAAIRRMTRIKGQALAEHALPIGGREDTLVGIDKQDPCAGSISRCYSHTFYDGARLRLPVEVNGEHA